MPIRSTTRLGDKGHFGRYVSIVESGVLDANELARLPYSLRVLLENVLRSRSRDLATSENVNAVAHRRVGASVPFFPARVLLQDGLAVPLLVDLAALRDAVDAAGGNGRAVNPRIPVDTVVDHSVRVDSWAGPRALAINMEQEHRRNLERFEFMRWSGNAYDRFRVVPPGKGIVHQVNLEHLAQVVIAEGGEDEPMLFPDTMVGTDSHTPMINGLGVLGWGVGGLEAEAAMLGRPLTIPVPRIIGVEITGALREGVTATDLVLTVTELLRSHGVVDTFVEFCGAGLGALSVADRGTIANMAPEYGATAVYFPIDDRTLEYLRVTGRSSQQVDLVESYCRAQNLWRDDDAAQPEFDELLTLDLSTVRASLAGPSRPEDRVDLDGVAAGFEEYSRALGREPGEQRTVPVRDTDYSLADGSVVIAAIASCTNTSNPVSMVTAGLVARNAVARGLRTRPWVKTSLTPGSLVSAELLEAAGLQKDLDSLGFQVAGFGCATCNGNSGPLPEPVVDAIGAQELLSVAVVSGNRNFEGRVHPNVKAAYLASPALVVAYALTGSIAVDLTSESLGVDTDGQPVYLRDIWPSTAEAAELASQASSQQRFAASYADLFEPGELWKSLPEDPRERFQWDPASTYLQRPPFFDELSVKPARLRDVHAARPLVILGDSITTDHISPSGAIPVDSSAGRYLRDHGVEPRDFNSYVSRRGNHEVVQRAAFASLRLRNRMVPTVEGPVTTHHPSGDVLPIYDAALRYRHEGTPLVVVAGAKYGQGSSRDSAAKGLALLGVRAVIAQSFERIHRSNLIGMGVLPLQLPDGTSSETLALIGSETFDIHGLDALAARATVRCTVQRPDGRATDLKLLLRADTPEEVETLRHGGLLPLVWRELVTASQP
ncbi:aconitate hydratase AcnA [Streptomyces sp. NPDC059134]|uniref:aconitate hydratase AcnA n=1 Tax=Streptomyces sp. NPDC059134 TaxID=3346738 RepID=UPI0036A9AE31